MFVEELGAGVPGPWGVAGVLCPSGVAGLLDWFEGLAEGALASGEGWAEAVGPDALGGVGSAGRPGVAASPPGVGSAVAASSPTTNVTFFCVTLNRPEAFFPEADTPMTYVPGLVNTQLLWMCAGALLTISWGFSDDPSMVTSLLRPAVNAHQAPLSGAEMGVRVRLTPSG